MRLLSVSPRPLQDSDEKSLKSLLSELKYLYTAITRAKVNLWVYDSSNEKRAPAFFFWLVKKVANLVKTSVGEMKDNLLFAAPSEKEQWSKQGGFYFRIRRWKLAMTCYEKAKLSYQVQVTKAYMMAEEAEKQPGELAIPYYQRAALAFLVADSSVHHVEYIEKAVYCLKKSRMFEMSAKVLEKMGQVYLLFHHI